MRKTTGHPGPASTWPTSGRECGEPNAGCQVASRAGCGALAADRLSCFWGGRVPGPSRLVPPGQVGVVPTLSLCRPVVAGGLALLGTALTSYVYVWATIGRGWRNPPTRPRNSGGWGGPGSAPSSVRCSPPWSCGSCSWPRRPPLVNTTRRSSQPRTLLGRYARWPDLRPRICLRSGSSSRAIVACRCWWRLLDPQGVISPASIESPRLLPLTRPLIWRPGPASPGSLRFDADPPQLHRRRRPRPRHPVLRLLERFGRFWGAFSVIDLFIPNAPTIVTEFIGVSLAVGYLGLPKIPSVLVVGEGHDIAIAIGAR